MYSNLSTAALIAGLALGLPGSAEACETHAGPTGLTRVTAAADHIVVDAAELAWKPAPTSLPPGAEIALIEGNPAESGPFTFRLKFPAGYEIPPHTHPAIEHVTVLSGSFGIGTGRDFDPAAGRELTAGGFVALPPGHPHFAWASEETVVQLHSIGPWGIAYLDPADDPRSY